jgi:hypothetical protein
VRGPVLACPRQLSRLIDGFSNFVVTNHPLK